VLAARDAFEGVSDADLIGRAATRIKAAREKLYCVANTKNSVSTIERWFRPCIPAANLDPSLHAMGAAMLIGLNPSWFGWDLQDFVNSQETIYDPITAIQMLAVEYDDDGTNEKFQCLIQGTRTVLGRASEMTQEAYRSLGLGAVPLGGAVGRIDCHIGGLPKSCGETSACIHYLATEESDFHICSLSDEDVVTVNGRRITTSSGNIPLHDEDVCTIGPRVFAFVLLSDK